MASLHLQPTPFGGDTGMEDTMEFTSDAGRVGGEDIDIDLDYPQEEEQQQHDDEYMLDDIRSNNGEQPPSVDMGMEEATAIQPDHTTITEPQILEDIQPETVNVDLPLDFTDAGAPQEIEPEEDLVEQVQVPEELNAEPFHGTEPTKDEQNYDVAKAEEVPNAGLNQQVTPVETVQNTNVVSIDSDDVDVSWDHSVYILFEGNEMALFPPQQDSDDSLTYLLQEKKLAYSKLNVLLSEIRSVLASAFSSGDEITMSVDVLDLQILEGSKFCTGYSLSDVVEIYQNLLNQDEHVDHSEPLWIQLHRKTSAEGRILALREAVSRQESLSSLGLWDAYTGPHNEHEESEESEYEEVQREEQEARVEEGGLEIEAKPDVPAVSDGELGSAPGEVLDDEHAEAQDSSATLQDDSLATGSVSEDQAARPLDAESTGPHLSQLSNPDDEEPIGYDEEEEEEYGGEGEVENHKQDPEESGREDDAANQEDEDENEFVTEEPSEEGDDNLDDPLAADDEKNYDDNYDDHAIHFSLDTDANQLQPGIATEDSTILQGDLAVGAEELDEPEQDPELGLVGHDFVDLASANDGAEENLDVENDFDGQEHFNSTSEFDEHQLLDDETWIKPPGQDFNDLESGQNELLNVNTDSAAPSSPVTVTNDPHDPTQDLEGGNDFLNLDYEDEDADHTLTGETQSPSSSLKRQHEVLEDDNVSIQSESKRVRPS